MSNETMTAEQDELRELMNQARAGRLNPALFRRLDELKPQPATAEQAQGTG
jgi:hypothetical protein